MKRFVRILLALPSMPVGLAARGLAWLDRWSHGEKETRHGTD